MSMESPQMFMGKECLKNGEEGKESTESAD